MQFVLGLIGLLFVPLTIGILSVRLICRPKQISAFVLFLSLPVGIAITSVTYFLARAILPFSLTTLIVIDLVVIIALFAANRGIALRNSLKAKSSGRSIVTVVAAILFGSLLCIYSSYFVQEVQSSPYGKFDAYWNWNQKAIFMNYSDLDLREALRFGAVPRHPIMLSCSVGRGWLYFGAPHPIVPIALAFTLCLALLGMVVSGVMVLKGPVAALIAGSALQVFGLFNLGASLYSDVLLATFVTGVFLALLLDMDFSPSLMGLMASFAMWAKNEGVVLFAAAVVSLLVISWLTGKRSASNFRSFLIFASPMLILFAFYKYYIGPHSSDIAIGMFSFEGIARILEFERHQSILKYGFKILIPDEVLKGPIRIIAQPFFILASAVVLLGISVKVGLRPFVLTGAGLIVCIIGGYYFSFVLIPFDLDQQLRTTYYRLFFHVIPALAILTALILRTPDGVVSDVSFEAG